MNARPEHAIRRLPAVLAIVAVLIAAGFVDGRFGRPHASGRAVVETMPIAAPAGALSSTWYCTGGTAVPNGAADLSVSIVNAGRTARTGTVTFVSSDGQSRAVPVRVPAASRAAVRAQDTLKAAFVSATVELDGGATAAEAGASGPFGDTATPCASSASDHWYFAEGATTKDAAETLFLFNPFPEDAIVDLNFSTEDGRSAPQGLQGLAVRGRGLTPVKVGDFVHRREAVSAEVVTRVGRIAASRLQSFDGTAGRKGQSLALGAPGPSQKWYFPEGLVAPGIAERYQLFNPSDREVRAELALALEQGAAEPIDVTVPAQARVTVNAADEKRIPRQVAHAVTITADAPGLVAERAIEAASPAPRAGFASIVGATALFKNWLFAVGAADDVWDEWIVVQNPGTAPVDLSVIALAGGQRLPVEGLQGVRVEAGQRRAVRLGEHIRRSDLPVTVEASGPVAVERDLYRAKGLATVMVIGTPLE
ncbi:MAG: hypothetical protein JWP02_2069 [Acidimicrobiales bacterium]|nr:hypothetical protein [Acidimicrobiales bacterium]